MQLFQKHLSYFLTQLTKILAHIFHSFKNPYKCYTFSDKILALTCNEIVWMQLGDAKLRYVYLSKAQNIIYTDIQKY